MCLLPRRPHLSALPARSLDGKVRTFSLSSLFTTRPADHLNITARFRRYDLRNDSPRIRFPEGYVRFDAVWEDIPRISVPYGNTTDAFTASATYDLCSVNLEPGAPANLLAVHPETVCPAGSVCNLRYDQSKKDIDRYGAHVELSPGGKGSLTFSYLKGKDKYTETVFGLVRADNEALSAEADYTPSDRVNLFAFYTRENISTFQRGRQSGATVSVNPLDNWTSEIKDNADSFGGGPRSGWRRRKWS